MSGARRDDAGDHELAAHVDLVEHAGFVEAARDARAEEGEQRGEVTDLGGEGLLAWTLRTVFGDAAKDLVKGYVDRHNRLKEVDAEHEIEKRRLPNESKLESFKEEQGLALPPPVPDLALPPAFDLIVDDSALKQLAAVGARARLYETNRSLALQTNLDAVIARTFSQTKPPGDPGERRPLLETMYRITEGARQAFDDEIREMWARLLASELTNPGRFDRRTFDVLSALSPDDAKLFDRACAYLIADFIPTENKLADQGLTYGVFVRLDEVGLFHRGLSSGLLHDGSTLAVLVRPDRLLKIEALPNQRIPDFRVPSVHSLTAAGRELSRFSKAKPYDGYYDEILKLVQGLVGSTCTVGYAKVEVAWSWGPT